MAQKIGPSTITGTATGERQQGSSSSSSNEVPQGVSAAPPPVRHSTYGSSVIKKKGPVFTSECFKFYAFVTFLFMVFYAILLGIFTGLLEAAQEDSDVTLMVFGYLFLVTIVFIAGMVISGYIETKRRQKHESPQSGVSNRT